MKTKEELKHAAIQYMLDNWGNTGGKDGWEYSEGYQAFIAGASYILNEIKKTIQ